MVLAEVPEEVMMSEILTRLPVRSVLRFRCVCKQWCSSMATPQFIREHLRKSKSSSSSNNRRIMIAGYHSSGFVFKSMSVYSKPPFHSCLVAYNNYPWSNRNPARIQVHVYTLETTTTTTSRSGSLLSDNSCSEALYQIPSDSDSDDPVPFFYSEYEYLYESESETEPNPSSNPCFGEEFRISLITPLLVHLANYTILLEDELTAKPVSISHVEASAIPFAALTAWRALKSTARITQGQRVLVVNGGGAVSFATIQLAVAAEYHVSSTCGSESVDRGMAAGAEQAVDYTTQDIESALKGQFDVALDTIGVLETEMTCINLLRKGGHPMTLQGEAASLTDRYGLAIGLSIASAILLKKQIQYRYSHGIGCDPKIHYKEKLEAENLKLEMVEIRQLSEVEKLKILVEKTFPITQVREAHEAKDKKLIPGCICQSSPYNKYDHLKNQIGSGVLVLLQLGLGGKSETSKHVEETSSPGKALHFFQFELQTSYLFR
ncbi:hypothetical protein ACSBR1_039578 [Camellia fascicularis]